jgi:hypothetical protein
VIINTLGGFWSKVKKTDVGVGREEQWLWEVLREENKRKILKGA